MSKFSNRINKWVKFSFSILGVLLINTFSFVYAADVPITEVWWPFEGAHFNNTSTNIPFKGMLQNTLINDYQMFWQVDGGTLNVMPTSYEGYPHKESTVDLSGWNWKGANSYKLTFKSKNNNGDFISEKSVNIYVDTPTSTPIPIAVSQPVIVAQPIIVSAIVTPLNLNINVWWPANNAILDVTSPFKAVVDGKNVTEYKMFWQVDNGNLSEMFDNATDYPHKESLVDMSGWKWRGGTSTNPYGPYILTFIAKDLNGNTVGKIDKTIYVKNIVQPTIITTLNNTSNTSGIFSGKKFYVNPSSSAAKAVSQMTNTTDINLMKKISSNSVATWLGGWSTPLDIQKVMKASKADLAMPIFVVYNIPSRDCGSYSSGGSNNVDSYKTWINMVAQNIKNDNVNGVIVVLEPDSLSQLDCLSDSMKNDRFSMLNYAVKTLKQSNAYVYLDAGHANWIAPVDMSDRLQKAGIASADGFSLNVSNFQSSDENTVYGKDISARVGNKHFIIDSSRNGNGSNGEWCNPSGRSLGNKPSANTGDSLIDAYLWIKAPGESDGNCNGGPSAGTWWLEYALGLARLTNW